jgi:hypothetical protein
MTTNLFNQKDSGIPATAAAVPERIPSEKQPEYETMAARLLENAG